MASTSAAARLSNAARTLASSKMSVGTTTCSRWRPPTPPDSLISWIASAAPLRTSMPSARARAGGAGTGAGPGSLTQLPEQVLDMCRHRPDARRDAVGDLAVAQTSGEDRQHVELSFRKAERRRFLGEGDDRRLSACGSVRSLDGDAVPASIKIEPEERHQGAIAHKEGR